VIANLVASGAIATQAKATEAMRTRRAVIPHDPKAVKRSFDRMESAADSSASRTMQQVLAARAIAGVPRVTKELEALAIVRQKVLDPELSRTDKLAAVNAYYDTIGVDTTVRAGLDKDGKRPLVMPAPMPLLLKKLTTSTRFAVSSPTDAVEQEALSGNRAALLAAASIREAESELEQRIVDIASGIQSNLRDTSDRTYINYWGRTFTRRHN